MGSHDCKYPSNNISKKSFLKIFHFGYCLVLTTLYLQVFDLQENNKAAAKEGERRERIFYEILFDTFSSRVFKIKMGTMDLIVAPINSIKFDIEVALEQQLGAQPLPFPGMDSNERLSYFIN